MRVDRPRERWFEPAIGVLLLIVGCGLGASLAGLAGGVAGGLVGLAGRFVLGRSSGKRAARRRAALARPFPAVWRSILTERYDHYLRLPAELARRFEDDVQLFLAEKRITGIEAVATEELKVLVAASAVTLSLGWPDYEWDQLSEVLLYPQDFDRDYGFEREELAGEAHPWGTVILSAPALVESFADEEDGYHVGLHEFAHLLDVDQTRFDGIPAGLSAERSRQWVQVMDKEMDRLRRGKSVIDAYGATDPAEFLAVAIEAFFELPMTLRQRHREVYAILSEYFLQDPAAWDDARFG